MEEKNQCLYGIHPIVEALRSGRRFEKILLKRGLEGSRLKEMMQFVEESGIPFQYVPAEKLDRVARGVHQGVVAIVAQVEYVDLEQFIANAFKASKAPLVILLDGVSDVRNLGAVARSLEVAGGQGIIMPAKGGAALNAEAVKASAGALLRLDTCKVSNLKLAAYALRDAGFRIFAASEKVSAPIYELDLTGPSAIIVGSEGKGVSKALLELADSVASIPQCGAIGSLNVSVASAIVVFEAVRQRMFPKG